MTDAAGNSIGHHCDTLSRGLGRRLNLLVAEDFLFCKDVPSCCWCTTSYVCDGFRLRIAANCLAGS